MEFEINPGLLTAWANQNLTILVRNIRSLEPVVDKTTLLIQQAWPLVFTPEQQHRLAGYLQAASTHAGSTDAAAATVGCTAATMKNLAERVGLIHRYLELVQAQDLTQALPPALKDYTTEPAYSIKPELAWTPTHVLLHQLTPVHKVTWNRSIPFWCPYLGQLVRFTHGDLLSIKGVGKSFMSAVEAALAQRYLRLAKGTGSNLWWTDLPPGLRPFFEQHVASIRRDPDQFWQRSLRCAARSLGTTREELLCCMRQIVSRPNVPRATFLRESHITVDPLGLSEFHALAIEHRFLKE